MADEKKWLRSCRVGLIFRCQRYCVSLCAIRCCSIDPNVDVSLSLFVCACVSVCSVSRSQWIVWQMHSSLPAGTHTYNTSSNRNSSSSCSCSCIHLKRMNRAQQPRQQQQHHPLHPSPLHQAHPQHPERMNPLRRRVMPVREWRNKQDRHAPNITSNTVFQPCLDASHFTPHMRIIL